MHQQNVKRLYPPPDEELALNGLYLQHALNRYASDKSPVVYTNFITSLDGRIAIEHPAIDGTKVPAAITNPRDWRLFQELAAQADVLVASARYIRELSAGKAQSDIPVDTAKEYADLHDWRAENGLTLQPAIVILSSSLDIPLNTLENIRDRPVYVATGENADPRAVAAIENTGASILYAGKNKAVDGKLLIDSLVKAGFYSIYSMAGPGVLETLLTAGVLNRLYLTQVHRLIGGDSFDTLLEGKLVEPPADFSLQALYYDTCCELPYGQFFGVYDTHSAGQSAK